VLVTRGWRDIFSMVKQKGGRMETMISLGGLGDLMMT
jgi:glycerol-3-phosphate dehydrogenase